MQKTIKILLIPLIIGLFLPAILFTSAQITDTSAISLNGTDWTLKVDSQLQTATDSKSTPYVSTTAKGEKELFLTLNSLEDCKLGYIQFRVTTTGLTVYKQLPLNEEIQLKENEYDFVNATHAMLKGEVKVYRPENVVNSFACFDASGKKVLHIYASQLIDNAGQKVWVDSDLVDGVLTVYLNGKWLESARFPVLLDPTFGYTNAGGTQEGIANTQATKTIFSLTETGTVTTLNLYCNPSGSDTYSVGIYNGNNLIVSLTESSSLNGAQWIAFNIEDTGFTAGDYGLAFKNKVYNSYFYYDSGTDNQTQFNTGLGTSADLPSTFTVNSQTARVYSIFVNYTSTEPTPTPTPTATPTPTPTAAPEPTTTPTEFTSTETWNIIILLVMLIVGLILALKRTLPILNFVFGMFAIAISAWTLTVAPYFGGLLQLAVIIIGIIVMVSGYKEVY